MESPGVLSPRNQTPNEITSWIGKKDVLVFSSHDSSLWVTELYSKGHKRIKLSNDWDKCIFPLYSSSIPSKEERSRELLKVVDYSDPSAVVDVLDQLDDGMYGSVTKDIRALNFQVIQALGPYFKQFPSLVGMFFKKEISPSMDASRALVSVIDLEDESAPKEATSAILPIVIIDSDDEDSADVKPIIPFEENNRSYMPNGPFQKVILGKSVGQPFIEVRDHRESTGQGATTLLLENRPNEDKGVYVGVEDEEENTESEAEDDGLGDIWNEMSLAMEVSKDTFEYPSTDEQISESEEYCDHSYVLKDDLGYVCRVCGVIKRRIETIIEIQFNKVKSSRTSMPTSRNSKDRDSRDIAGLDLSEDDLVVTDISAHPRHLKQMKPHQVEGFKFLCSNLVADSPGGCILAHAPGSGKTFMIISFMQSFMAKYPHARPLVVLPKGILQTWKREFQLWQIEDIPLLDFYTAKADSRAQQFEVLKQWMDERSILFLGYKQFSTIVCDEGKSKAAIGCQEILLRKPSILILDEGHTPRNEDTDVLQSLAKVQTPRKVVLSGTLYQNHVKEVFNILNLVRPKFLKSETSRLIIKRIMSKVHIPFERKQFRGELEAAFYEMVEHTIQRDHDFKRKVTIIHDLREMTSKVLHYYKGDFLDELPGLVDFTVVLNLTPKQRHKVRDLKKLSRKFKRNSVGSAVYLHPKLHSSENPALTDDRMDSLLENIDFRDGAKAKFFLNILSLCESSGEKLLVFSQYLPPLKFLERMVMKVKGWCLGKEFFVISGESSSDQREWSMERFNNSDAKVFFGSIKACGEGISLVGASRIIILDVHLNPSVTRQAIGRAFRPGQKKKVYAYRLVASDSPEEEDHSVCFRKEAIAKMWFEWNEYCGFRDFEMESVELKDCGDLFLESPLVGADIKALYKR